MSSRAVGVGVYSQRNLYIFPCWEAWRAAAAAVAAAADAAAVATAAAAAALYGTLVWQVYMHAHYKYLDYTFLCITTVSVCQVGW